MEEGNVFFANTMPGHRAFNLYKKRNTKPRKGSHGHTMVRDYLNHNSHILIIQKRRRPHPEVEVVSGTRAKCKPLNSTGKKSSIRGTSLLEAKGGKDLRGPD